MPSKVVRENSAGSTPAGITNNRNFNRAVRLTDPEDTMYLREILSDKGDLYQEILDTLGPLPPREESAARKEFTEAEVQRFVADDADHSLNCAS